MGFETNYDCDSTYDCNVNIKVVGVGGGGGNAVNRMVASDVKGVEFIVVNTDAQALKGSLASNKLTIGEKLTSGHGAGSDPSIGQKAAEESEDKLRECLDGAEMVFVTAGMGGGTGTGAAPVVAKVARELDALTVGIVTTPFAFEGRKKKEKAEAGISELKKYVDSLIIIPNDNLGKATNTRITLANAYQLADDILRNAVKSVAEVITTDSFINVDFADVKTIMKNAGYAIMSMGEGSGKDKVSQSVDAVLKSPLIEKNALKGASGVLFSVTTSMDIALDDVQAVADLITSNAHPDANIIYGHNFDSTMEDKIRITLIATGSVDTIEDAQVAAPSSANTPKPPVGSGMKNTKKGGDDEFFSIIGNANN